MKPIISVDTVTKIYHINPTQKKFRTSLRETISTVLHNPHLLLQKQQQNFAALQRISFDVEKGETIGIIGQNGSGKSTLLKILSGITYPTKGKAIIRGTIASILGIGIGFHSDLTGRENIFLNGAILGFSQKTIEKEFANIVAFSGVEKFIDTPVKYYSSGMYLRLAFAIATAQRIEPDILLLDEILSVGDRAFQNQCIERIKSLVQNKNTTVLMVSHNLEKVKTICTKCLWLDKGIIKMFGFPKDVISKYKLLYDKEKR